MSMEEIRAFIGVILFMGLNKREAMCDHWSSNEIFQSVISSKISEGKFKLLLRFLHIQNNEKQKESMDKVNETVQYIVDIWN